MGTGAKAWFSANTVLQVVPDSSIIVGVRARSFLVEDVRFFTEDLWPQLIGRVFHVTNAKAFAKIREDGYVRNNKDGRFGFTFPQSKVSLFRNEGCVSLFDFRSQNARSPATTMDKFPFWMVENYDPVILLLDPTHCSVIQHHPRLGTLGRSVFVRGVEVGWPGDLPVEAIDERLEINYSDSFLDRRRQELASEREEQERAEKFKFDSMVQWARMNREGDNGS